MNKIDTLPEDEPGGEIYSRVFLLLRKEGGGWRAAGAVLGLGAGLSSALLATVLEAAAVVIGPIGLGPALHVSSTVLFVSTLPMLAVGAHFLDLLEKRPPALPLPGLNQPAVRVRGRRLRARPTS